MYKCFDESKTKYKSIQISFRLIQLYLNLPNRETNSSSDLFMRKQLREKTFFFLNFIQIQIEPFLIGEDFQGFFDLFIIFNHNLIITTSFIQISGYECSDLPCNYCS